MDYGGSFTSDLSSHLKDLMLAGQQSAKRFDEALLLTMGMRSEAGAPSDAISWTMAFLSEMHREYLLRASRFWAETFIQMITLGAYSSVEPSRGDKRFKDEAWREVPYYDLLKQSYLLSSRQLRDFVEQAQVDEKSKLQLRFFARQFIDAMSPSNFPLTNPAVIRTAIKSRSASLIAGMQNFIEDVQKGRITRVDEAAFEVGGNLAVTPGSVIFENELIQLIQYTPKTVDVERTPLLIVPPCINKYYLLDLGKENSFVEYAVSQGHQVFLISWRSAVAETQHLTWDDYLKLGPLQAIDIVREVAGVDKIHSLGFCVGGTILSCAAGVLAANRTDKLASITLLTTMLDFSDSGEIGLLLDEASIALREAAIGQGGILPGKELAFTFGTLRANDLIWQYVVDSYRKGATPEAICSTGTRIVSVCLAQCIAGTPATPIWKTR